MSKLSVAIQMQLEADEAMQRAVDELLKPTTTGYLHAPESWSIAWVRRGDGSAAYQIAVDPPEGAFELNYATAARIEYVRLALGADSVYVLAIKQSRVRYIATWNKEPAAADLTERST